MIDRETEHAKQFAKLGDAAGPSWAALTSKERAALWRQYRADALADDAADADQGLTYVVIPDPTGGPSTTVFRDGSWTYWIPRGARLLVTSRDDA
jgi:hypothetical protein